MFTVITSVLRYYYGTTTVVLRSYYGRGTIRLLLKTIFIKIPVSFSPHFYLLLNKIIRSFFNYSFKCVFSKELNLNYSGSSKINKSDNNKR